MHTKYSEMHTFDAKTHHSIISGMSTLVGVGMSTIFFGPILAVSDPKSLKVVKIPKSILHACQQVMPHTVHTKCSEMHTFDAKTHHSFISGMSTLVGVGMSTIFIGPITAAPGPKSLKVVKITNAGI